MRRFWWSNNRHALLNVDGQVDVDLSLLYPCIDLLTDTLEL